MFKTNSNKSLLLTYIFSLIGGPVGLHHLYLGRTQHALLWFTTFGGFGIGLIYEFLFLLKTYVSEANCDTSILQKYQLKMRLRKSPSWEIRRLIGQYLTAVFYGFIMYYAFPDTWHKQPVLSLMIACFSAIAIALGTYTTGTLGPRQCSFIWPLLGAIIGIPLLIHRADSSPSFNMSAILSSIIFEWKIEWNPLYFSDMFIMKSNECQSSSSSSPLKPKRRHCIKRCIIFGIGVILFSTIFSSAIYQNLQVDINGQHVKIKDVLKDFIKSQEFLFFYQQSRNIMKQLWNFYLQYGLKGIWTQIWMELDSQNEKQAFQTLQLPYNASQKEITSQCRRLSRDWHPDRFKKSEEKQQAEKIFMNIQQACNRLSNERKRRQILNTQKRENPK